MVDNEVNKYITILTFTYSHEMVMARALLESHEIECSIQDELTTQVVPFYSNAIGGIKLQVQEGDLQKAIRLLIDAGYMDERDLQPEKPLFDIDKFTSKFPIVKKAGFEMRLLLVVISVIVVVASIVYFVTLPSAFERLTKNDWCLSKVTYKNKNYLPQTNNILKITGMGFCDESITFKKNGTVTLPGFQSPMVRGNWRLEDDLLHISSEDTFAFVYNGIYHIDFNNATLELKSSHTRLYCHVEEIQLNLPF
jgi:hypothetical protein